MELLKRTPFEAGWLVWEPRPREKMLTVAVKATYDLPETGDAALTDAQDFLSGDLYLDDDVERGLRWASDLEPLKPCGECFVIGSYHGGGGQPVERSLASFRVGALEKSVAVTGDRTWRRGGPTPPTPFSEMSLAWERSFGGPGHDDNPIGRGLAADPIAGQVLLPNLEDPRDNIAGGSEQPRTYGIAPIPRGFRSRLRHAGTYDARWLAERYPGFAEDLDYRLFLASPEDQRAQGFFRGDETLELRHLHPTHAKVSARLPGHRAQAFLCRDGVLTDVGLRLDTVVIDADAGRVSLVWRGVVSVQDPALADIEHLFVVHQEAQDRHAMADYAAWYQRAVEEEKDTDAEAEPVPSGSAAVAGPAPASFGLSADVVAAEIARRRREAPEPDDRPFDTPGAKWAHLDQAMTVRGDDTALQAAIDEELARRRGEEKSSAFRPVFEGALGAGVMKPREELTDEERLEAEMALALAELDEEKKPDAERLRVRDAIRAGESCAGWDLSGVDLSGLDLSGGDFTGAILARANLSGVHARATRFDRATLTEAELSYAVFHEASFEGADLSPVRAERVRFAECRFDRVSAIECYFRNARFARCSFADAELSQSELGEAIFEECTLDGADLSRAHLEGATFVRSTLVDAWLEGIRAERASFDGCDCSLLRASEASELSGASFKRAKLDGARFSTSKLRGASFAFASLTRADFQGAMLAQAKLVGCSMRHARFDGAVLVQASLMKSDLYQARFERADLSHADLRGASLFQAELLGAKLDDAQLGLAFVDGTRIA